MWTLHGYLARELLKTFLMTTAALTLLIVMGGGVANLFRSQGIGAEDMARVFMFLTPVALTLILPVAALFSAAITYGRAAADNEMLACRAAGINIHTLLLSAALLGVFVTTFTYWSWNYMIPHLLGRIERLSRRDLLTIVQGEFAKARPLSFGKYRLMANRCEVLDPAALEDVPLALREDHDYLWLTGVSFIELADNEPARYGTADETVIRFDNRESIPRVTVDLQGVRSFDSERRQYYELEHQPLGPYDIPIRIKHKTKFENLGKLRFYIQHPETIPEMEDRLFGLTRGMMTWFLAMDMEEHHLRGAPYALEGGQFSYEVSAERFVIDDYDGRPRLASVTVVETRGDQKRVFAAERAHIELKTLLDPSKPVIVIELVGDVRIRRLPATDDARIVQKPGETLASVDYLDQPRLQSRVASYDFLALLDKDGTIDFDKHLLPRRQTRLREKLIERLQKFKAEVLSEIHFRAAYSLCAIAIVLFGAVLGIIMRGGQVLTAFGISCIPMVFVVVASIVGRNLADRPGYTTLSIGVMWSATVFMYLATGVVAVRVLKR